MSSSYQQIINDRMTKFKNAGLTPEEIELLTTPVSKFRSPQERAMAFAIRDKYDTEVRKRNEEQKQIEKAERAKLPFAVRIGTPVVRAETTL